MREDWRERMLLSLVAWSGGALFFAATLDLASERVGIDTLALCSMLFVLGVVALRMILSRKKEEHEDS